MPMTNNGLSKLVEELGECQQIAGKMLQFPDLQTDRGKSHPDGVGALPLRMENEIADVLAACDHVVDRLGLDRDYIEKRATAKEKLFRDWSKNK